MVEFLRSVGSIYGFGSHREGRPGNVLDNVSWYCDPLQPYAMNEVLLRHWRRKLATSRCSLLRDALLLLLAPLAAGTVSLTLIFFFFFFFFLLSILPRIMCLSIKKREKKSCLEWRKKKLAFSCLFFGRECRYAVRRSNGCLLNFKNHSRDSRKSKFAFSYNHKML